MMPSIFVSHGSPMMALEKNATTAFFHRLGEKYPTPTAIVMFSAHYDKSDAVHVTGAGELATIHDFYGFPPALYQVQYPAQGDQTISDVVVDRLQSAGFPVVVDSKLGLDHGAWVPLMHMYPQHNIPVVSVSINSRVSAKVHTYLGEQLRTLREQGVMFVGSGGISHNLREIFAHNPDKMRTQKVKEFVDWIGEKVVNRDAEAINEYLTQAPYAQFNHPSPDHFLPLPCIVGTSYAEERGQILHSDIDLDILALDAYGFGI